MKKTTTPSFLIRSFQRLKSSGLLSGLLLISFSLFALIAANSPLNHWYESLVNSHFYIGVKDLTLSKPILLWINDGLMALFFLLIGLELKREILEGELSNRAQIFLPAAAALGGIIVPGFIYYLFNHQDNPTIRGWAIPTATDIAFALGVLTMLGSRVPVALRIFLTTVAMFDDFAAILIIAIFYTAHLSAISLLLAALAIGVLLVCNYLKVANLSVYLLVGLFLWLFVLKSGVHATLAGVILGFTIPHRLPGKQTSLLLKLEKDLHPWVNYFILPLFAFSNAGINFSQVTLAGLLSPPAMGIILGLFLGKQLGIFGVSFLLIKAKWAQLPRHTAWQQFYGACVLCGIGFTMSLFICSLALEDTDLVQQVISRLAIFLGSILSAVVGYGVIRLASSHKAKKENLRNPEH